MENKKDDSYYIAKVKEHLNNIIDYLANVDDIKFFKNKILQSAVCFEYIQIFENSRNISDGILDVINDFPLHELRGLRNRLVHDYGNVDYTVIYESAKNDVPILLEQLNKIELR